jgi:hypothetical protein
LKGRTSDRGGPGGTGVGRLLATGVVSRVVVKWWCFDGGGWRMDDGGIRGVCVYREILGYLEEIRSGWERVAPILVGALLVL